MKTGTILSAALLFTLPGIAAQAAEPATGVKVTPSTYIRAETDRSFHNIETLGGGINRFYHIRQPTPLDKQTIVRMNRDTLYSGAVIDTSKGATITLPKADKGRYMSILVIDNDHYAPTVNRLDTSAGWNFLMRIYRPGASVLDGSYKLPKTRPVAP